MYSSIASMTSGTLRNTPLHALVGVGRVVVADQVHVQVRRDLFVDEIEEPDPFVMAVTGQAGADDVAGQRAERGEQGRRPIPFVVVCHRAGSPFLIGNPGCVRSRA